MNDRRLCSAYHQSFSQWTDQGSLGSGFAYLAIIVFIALCLQLVVLRPKTDNME